MLAASAALAADEVRIMWYSDGNENQVMAELLKQFEQQNPDIKVVLDNVSYQVGTEQLPIALEAGKGPISPGPPTSRRCRSTGWT